jgi:hypothetical protein
MWIGLLFAVICIAEPNVISTYRKKIAQCLILGKYTKCPRYTIETLLLYHHIESLGSENSRMETLILLGVVVKLAHRMGYHKDPLHFPTISPFQGEMRRRTWALLVQIDALASANMGLPRTIRESHCDTTEPSNLLDDDLNEDLIALPPSKPSSVRTPVQYIMTQNKFLSIYCNISDLMTSAQTPDYAEIIRLDNVLLDTYAAIPRGLKIDSAYDPIIDAPDLIKQQLHIALVFQKARCLLHDPVIASGWRDREYDASHSICIQAALCILQYQGLMSKEIQINKRHLQDILLTSFAKSAFLLATSILCREMYLEKNFTVEPTSNHSQTDSMKSVREALHTGLRIWMRETENSTEARKMVKVLQVVLRKATEIDATKPMLGKLNPIIGLYNY